MTTLDHLNILKQRLETRAGTIDDCIESEDDMGLIMALGAFDMAITLVDEEIQAVQAEEEE